MLISPKNARKRRIHGSSTTDTSIPRRRGRPMKRPGENDVSRSDRRALGQKIHSQVYSAAHMSSAADLSPLEKLPIELIQHIFFDALEVNLANASQTLNQALSKESIYRALILFAYFDDDGCSPVETTQFRPAEFRRLDPEDRVELQLGVLKCKWCNLDRIKGCMPALSRLTMVQAWHREQRYEQQTFSGLLGDATCAPKEIIRVPNDDILDIAPLPDIMDDSAMQDHFSARLESLYYRIQQLDHQAIGPISEGGFLPFIQCWDYFPLMKENQDGLVHKLVARATATLGVMVIPDKLLVGDPWTKEKLGFLQLLRQGLRYKRHSPFTVIRAAAIVKGMENAIGQGSVDILRILIELDERVVSIYTDGPELDQNDDLVLSNADHSNRSPNALPLRLFQMATRSGATSSEMLSLLIRASWRSIDPDDPTLTGWALRAEANGDILGSWLKIYMEGAHGQDLEQRPVFINGAVSWRLRVGNYPFPESSFTNEVGYIHDNAPDLPMRRWTGK